MKVNQPILLAGIYFLTAIGCSNKSKSIPIEILFSKTLTVDQSNQYPDEIKNLCLPFKDVCGASQTKKTDDYGFSKIILFRIDLANSVELTYLNNAGNLTNINYIERQEKKFFKENKVDQILIHPTNKNFNFQTYFLSLKDKQSYFIFSKNVNLKVDSMTIYNSIDDLRKAISDTICSQDGTVSKIIVIYDPEVGQEPIRDSTRFEDIRTILLKVNGYYKLSFEIRETEIDKIISNSFANNFSISRCFDQFDPSLAKNYSDGREYLDELASNGHLNDLNVSNVTKDNNGKILHIDVVEIQKKDIDIQPK